MAWPAQQSRAAGFTWAMCTHICAHAFIHTQAQTRLSPPAADRDKSVQSDKSASVCVREEGAGGVKQEIAGEQKSSSSFRYSTEVTA